MSTERALNRSQTTSKSKGDEAERVACIWLHRRGFATVYRNWRNAHAEIDIVARKDKILYFIEVKYRANSHQGEGFQAVTPARLAQLAKASEYFSVEEAYYGPRELMILSLSGTPPVVVDCFDEITT